MSYETQTLSAGHPATEVVPRVYSYTRFSTPEQLEGDSLRRQTDSAKRWMLRKNEEREVKGLAPLVFDERLKLEDLGVSAFRGANVAPDKGLGGFLSACREGLIPVGSFLIVESFDRISRMTPLDMLILLNDIVRAGVTLVTINDGNEYDLVRLTKEPSALMIALMVASRAHEESKVKGERLSAAWQDKRKRVRAGTDKRLTRKGPSWLEPDGDGWKERQPQADNLRRIYQMTLDGMGEHKIAHVLNEEKVPVMGRGQMWHRSTISKLLRSPATIGTLVPGRMDYSSGQRCRKLEEPILGAFPAVVSDADWEAVRVLKDGKAPAVRGKGATGKLKNLFAGLARCPECGATMTRVMKGNTAKGGQPKLVCVKAKAGAASHSYKSVTLAELHCAVQEKWQELLIDIPAGENGGSIDADIANLQALVMVTVEDAERHAEAVLRKPSHEAEVRRRGVEATLASYQADLRRLEHQRVFSDQGLVMSRAEAFAEAMEGNEGIDLARANARLRMLFKGVTVDYAGGLLRFHWRQGGETSLRYAWTDYDMTDKAQIGEAVREEQHA